MKTTRRHEWLLLSTLTLTGILLFSLFHIFAVRFIPPAEDVRDYYAGVVGFVDHMAGHNAADTIDADVDRTGRIGNTLVLKFSEAVKLGGSILIYRGLTSTGGFEINVVIPAFDPERPFPYTFTAAEARKGFSLVNRSFRLLSATRSYLHLEQVKK